MNFFDEAALRLKQQLQVRTDKEVAEALGLSAVAWVGRKKRDNFPEVELYALAAKRPDLKINVEYVLTGRAPQPSWGTTRRAPTCSWHCPHRPRPPPSARPRWPGLAARHATTSASA